MNNLKSAMGTLADAVSEEFDSQRQPQESMENQLKNLKSKVDSM